MTGKMPDAWAEIHRTKDDADKVIVMIYVNNPTPSGQDRPRLMLSTPHPVSLEQALASIKPHVVVYLDGVVYREAVMETPKLSGDVIYRLKFVLGEEDKGYFFDELEVSPLAIRTELDKSAVSYGEFREAVKSACEQAIFDRVADRSPYDIGFIEFSTEAEQRLIDTFAY